MPQRITNANETGQLNKAVDRITKAEARIIQLQQELAVHAGQLSQLDFVHGVQTSNNLVFTWTGDNAGHGKITWPQGWLKDKNAATALIAKPLSAAPGHFHILPIPANSTGITGLNPSTYYWMGWNKLQQQMIATTDVSIIYQNFNAYVVCQLFTGTTAQTGVAGGGGVNGGIDLSGAKYKLF
jgi:hypothetical protein